MQSSNHDAAENDDQLGSQLPTVVEIQSDERDADNATKHDTLRQTESDPDSHRVKPRCTATGKNRSIVPGQENAQHATDRRSDHTSSKR